MYRKLATVAALAMMVMASACDEKLDLATGPLATDVTKARIRVANASATAFDVAINDNAYLGGGNIGYGASSCAQVDPANPQLSLKTVGTSTTPSTTLPNFTMPTLTLQANKDYQLIVYTTGTTRSAVLLDQGGFAVADPLAIGLRFFNAASATTGNVDMHVVATTSTALSAATAKATNIAPGSASSYFEVLPSATQVVRFARSATPTTSLSYSAPASGSTFTSSTIIAAPKSNSTIILAPASSGSGVRAFMVGDC
jgi:hypothetical protein